MNTNTYTTTYQIWALFDKFGNQVTLPIDIVMPDLEHYRITQFIPPRHEGSTGKVIAQPLQEELVGMRPTGYPSRLFYPSVFDWEIRLIDITVEKSLDEIVRENKKYNGWATYETWRIALEHFDGTETEIDPHLLTDITELAWSLKSQVEDYIDNNNDNIVKGYAHSFIENCNFYEIASNIINEHNKLTT